MTFNKDRILEIWPGFAIWIMAVMSVLSVVYLLRGLKEMKKAKRAVDQQFNVLDTYELEAFRDSLESDEQRQKWDALLARLKEERQTLRFGHFFLMIDTRVSTKQAERLPSFTPPDTLPYSIMHDAGVPLFRRYMVAHAEGRLVEAFKDLKTGVDMGSPLCITGYAVRLIKGDVPGLSANPDEAIRLLEKAMILTRGKLGAAELGEIWLKGDHVLANPKRGIDYMAQAEHAGNTMVALTLAAIYRDGRFGVRPDGKLAVEWGLKTAPKWRQFLAALGISQSGWVNSVINYMDASQREFQTMSPWDVKKREQEMVSQLKGKV